MTRRDPLSVIVDVTGQGTRRLLLNTAFIGRHYIAAGPYRWRVTGRCALRGTAIRGGVVEVAGPKTDVAEINRGLTSGAVYMQRGSGRGRGVADATSPPGVAISKADSPWVAVAASCSRYACSSGASWALWGSQVPLVSFRGLCVLALVRLRSGVLAC